MNEKTFDLVVDAATKRPGCVLLQATYGCDSRLVSELFDPATWVLAPTEKMLVVNGTREQWEGHAQRMNHRATLGEFK